MYVSQVIDSRYMKSGMEQYTPLLRLVREVVLVKRVSNEVVSPNRLGIDIFILEVCDRNLA